MCLLSGSTQSSHRSSIINVNNCLKGATVVVASPVLVPHQDL